MSLITDNRLNYYLLIQIPPLIRSVVNYRESHEFAVYQRAVYWYCRGNVTQNRVGGISTTMRIQITGGGGYFSHDIINVARMEI